MGLFIFALFSLFSSISSLTMQSQCINTTCCVISEEELCPLSEISDDSPTLIFPGGNTRCIKSTSTPYAFQVYRGSNSKILFYFQGGGSCWDQKSSFASGSDIKNTRCRTDAIPWPVYGVFDRLDPRNPYHEYTIVNVLYCSGDNHIGNITRDYPDEEGILIKQVGANNVLSVISWVKSQLSQGHLSTLTDFIIMGCSAGSIASQIWSNEIIKELKPSKTSVVLDSYIGLFPEEVESKLITEFGICSLYFLPSNFKDLCQQKQLKLSTFLYNQMKSSPSIPYLFIHSLADRVEIKYYNYLSQSYNLSVMSTELYIQRSNEILLNYNNLSNVLVYYIDSSQHCYTPTPYLYYTDVSGIEIGDEGGESDDNLVGDHDPNESEIKFDTKKETLNKWLSRLPLSQSESISSQCRDDVCQLANQTILIPKTYTQFSDGVSDEINSFLTSYSPSSLVRFIQSYPHLNSQLVPVTLYDYSSQTYTNTLSNMTWKEYLHILWIFPLTLHMFLMFVGLVTVFVVVTREIQSNVRFRSGVYVKSPVYEGGNERGGRGNESDDESISFELNEIYPSLEYGAHSRDDEGIERENDLKKKRKFWSEIASKNNSPVPISSPSSFSRPNSSSLFPSTLYWQFLFFLCLTFISNLFLFVGYSLLHTGISDGVSAMNVLHNSLSSLSSTTSLLLHIEQNTTLYLEQSLSNGCDESEGIINLLKDFSSAIESYKNILSSFLPTVQTITSITNRYTIQSLDIFCLVLFTLFVSVVLCYSIVIFSASRSNEINGSGRPNSLSTLLLFTIIFSVAVYILTMIFGTIYLIALMALSDYCLDPSQYIFLWLPTSVTSSPSLSSTLSYYLTCSGSSPLSENIFTSQYSTSQFQFYSTYLSTHNCRLTYPSEEISWNILQLQNYLTSLSSLSSCENLSSDWSSFLEVGTCQNIFNGLFSVWLTQLFTACCLLLTAMKGSELYPYLLGTKDTDDEMKNESDGESESRRWSNRGLLVNREVEMTNGL